MIYPFDSEQFPRDEMVILYGAAMYGELAFHALQELGIPVFSFCDRVQAGKQFCGLPVMSPEELQSYPDAHILICATKGFQGIYHYLQQISCEHCYEISGLLPYLNYEKLPAYCKQLPVDELIEKYQFYLTPQEPSLSSPLSLSFVALSITERCTLRCKKCSVLAPYYKKPCDDSYDSIIKPFEAFLSCVDTIAELQIGGGEPLMHRDLDKILTWCVKQDKIKEISIFTNSTIIPNPELTRVLTNQKIKLLLDDYGELSRNLNSILALCNQNGIRYLIQRFERWDDLGDYHDKKETDAQLTQKFRYCSFGNVMSFMKGKLYRCTTAARIADLGLVPDHPEDYVDFNHHQASDVWKKQILQLIYHKKFHEGCRLCNGISTYQLGIPVAEQL
nr:radical SAM protein [uncultured Agathobaculum sp.]